MGKSSSSRMVKGQCHTDAKPPAAAAQHCLRWFSNPPLLNPLFRFTNLTRARFFPFITNHEHSPFGNGNIGVVDSGDGRQYVGLQLRETFIEQELNDLTIGQVYTVSFLATNRPGFGDNERLEVSLNYPSHTDIVFPSQHPADTFTRSVVNLRGLPFTYCD